ncbi:pectate lyase-like adhesive domain-containing protein, partial [Enterococcus sp. AZ015]|uniref:pectate lyase-like adhesive domain-containing protein n=1 Tax=Enterococcus sp. AZ015 TaxID=2774888 RepID=UPI003D2A5655
MITRFRRPMLVLGTTILIMQAIFTPVGMVYAKTTVDTEEQELMELPPMKNYLEEEPISIPHFFFTHSRMQGTIEVPLQVTFFSNQEVSEVRILIPEEATIIKDKLPTGISVEEGAQPNEWIFQSKRAQNTFVLPLVFVEAGNYELSVEETTAHLEIIEKEEMNEKVPVEETELSEDDPTGKEELKEDNGIEEDPENEQPAEEVRDPVSEAPQEQQTDSEETDEASQVVEPTVFDGETAEVATMAEFREAVANPAIGIISVQTNLTEATANILTVDRSLLIQGNGYTLTFGHNDLYFQLGEVPEPCIFRIENATLTKVNARPLVNSTAVNSTNWTFEMEDTNELSANSMKLANLPNGRILFTGGESNFTRPAADQTFIQAKEIIATNNTKVIIDRGAASIFFSDSSIAAPKIEVKNGASIYLSVSSHIPAIYLQGSNSHIHVNGGNLTVTSSAGVSMNLTGQAPSISVAEESEVTMDGLVALTGSEPEVNIKNSKIRLDQLSLIGDQARLILDASEVTISSASNRTLLLLDGSNSLLSLDNQSRLEVISTWATTVQSNGSDTVRLGNGKKQPTLSVKNESKLAITAAGSSSTNIGPDASFNNGLHIGGASAHVEILQDSLVDVTITSGRRRRAILWSGANSTVEVSNSRLNINDSLGWSEINFGTTGIPKISI